MHRRAAGIVTGARCGKVEVPMPEPSASLARAPFQYPNFRYYQAARFIVVCAMEMQSVAVGWQIFSITHRALDLGLAGLAQFLPGIVLFLLGGHAADRLNRRSIVLACFSAFGLCSLLLLLFTIHGLSSARPIYLVLVFMGIIRAFNGPAAQAFFPQLVPEEVFPTAVAWSSSIFMTATIAGPSLGGLLYGFSQTPITVYASALGAFAVAIILVSNIRLRDTRRVVRDMSLRTVMAGFRYIGEHKVILGAITLDLFAVMLGGAVALLPVYARDILRSGPMGLGILRSSPGLGAAIMALVLAYHPLRRRAGAIMLWCVAGFGVFTIVFGLSRAMVLSVAALALVGATDMVSIVVRSNLVQLNTPNEMRGRVSAVNMLFIGTSNEFGQFESGITAHWFGTVPAVVLGGVGTLVVVAVCTLLFPELRRVEQMKVVPREIPEESHVVAEPGE